MTRRPDGLPKRDNLDIAILMFGLGVYGSIIAVLSYFIAYGGAAQ